MSTFRLRTAPSDASSDGPLGRPPKYGGARSDDPSLLTPLCVVTMWTTECLVGEPRACLIGGSGCPAIIGLSGGDQNLGRSGEDTVQGPTAQGPGVSGELIGSDGADEFEEERVRCAECRFADEEP